jgi:hypothetical protein
MLTDERIENLLQGRWSAGYRPRRKTVRAEPEGLELQPAPLEGKPLEALEPGECNWPVNEAGRGSVHLFCGRQQNGADQ